MDDVSAYGAAAEAFFADLLNLRKLVAFLLAHWKLLK